MPPLVSVLTTVYNRAPYIAPCIESVLAQTMDDLELIIVDDCSTDGSFAVAERYRSDPRVRLYRNERNLGDYPNRNRAASLARGTYLKYVDGDDLIYPHCLALMVEGMETFLEAGYGLSRDFPGAMAPVLLTPSEAYREHFFRSGLFTSGPLDAIIRRDAFEEVGGFSPARYTSDTDFFLRLGARWDGVILVPGLVWWRHHPEQESLHEKASVDRVMEVVLRHHGSECEALAAPLCPLRTSEIRLLRRRATIRMFRLALGQLGRGHIGWAAQIAKVAHAIHGKTSAMARSKNINPGLGAINTNTVIPSLPSTRRAPPIKSNWINIINGAGNNSSMPSISVLLPVHNGENHIVGAIQSVLAQDFRAWELIVVDDASDDDSFKLATQYDNGDNIKVLRNPETIGRWRTYNRAAKYARGRHLLLAVTDELWFPHALQICFDLMEKSESSIGIPKNRLVHPMGSVLKPRDFYRLQFMAPPPVADQDRIFVCRRSVWEASDGFREDRVLPKVDLALRIAVSHDVVVLPEGLNWVEGGDSIARADRLWRTWIETGRRDLLELIDNPEAPLSDAERQALIAGLTGAAIRQCLNLVSRGHIMAGLQLWRRQALKLSDLPLRKCFSPWIPVTERHAVYLETGS